MADPPALSAPDFVLALLDSAPNVEIRAAKLISAADAFDIDARTVRVALARLTKQGVLRALERGLYGIGPRGAKVQQAVLAWSRTEATLKPWDGRWFAVFQGHLQRSNKTAMRAAERALRLKGFESADPGLAIRPANLRAGLPAVRDALIALGLPPTARVMLIDQAVPDHDFARLWDRGALQGRYRAHLAALQDSNARVAKLDAVQAARETLLLGRAVIRDIVLDPLLPEQLVDVELRQRMIEAMKRYDRLGKRCWREFYAAIGGAPGQR